MDIDSRATTRPVSDEQLRVRLLLLLRSYQGPPAGAFGEVMLESAALGAPEDDARSALRYWADQNCLKRSDDGWEITETGRARASRLSDGKRTRETRSPSIPT
jgi:hypothetical protein